MSDEQLEILVIDDDPLDRKNVSRLLGKQFLIREAESGELGLEEVKRQPADCVLLDNQLPDLDGVDLLTDLTTRQVPVVMLTGAGNEELAAHAFREGATDYLSKDKLTSAILIKAITDAVTKGAVNRQRQLQQEELELFAGTVAHDLKAPLRAITVFSELVLEEVRGNVSEDVANHLQTVIEQAGNMTRLVNDLLGYARVGKDAIVLRPIELRDVLEQVTFALQTDLQELGGTLHVSDLPMVEGDETRLLQLFQNIISNGLKFRRNEPPVVTVTATEEAGMVVVSIADNGIGIPERFLEEIFAPLRRLHAASQYEGSGIGLATCRRIVEQHGGKLRVESTEGVGTTFFFTLRPHTPS